MARPRVTLIAGLALTGSSVKSKSNRPEAEALGDDYFEPYLQRIEREIHDAPNRTRHSMNNALIAIGMRGGTMKTKALAVAKRIGKVEVDHGQTNCVTPDAAAYIKKALDHYAKKVKTTKASRHRAKPRSAAAR